MKLQEETEILISKVPFASAGTVLPLQLGNIHHKSRGECQHSSVSWRDALPNPHSWKGRFASAEQTELILEG